MFKSAVDLAPSTTNEQPSSQENVPSATPENSPSESMSSDTIDTPAADVAPTADTPPAANLTQDIGVETTELSHDISEPVAAPETIEPAETIEGPIATEPTEITTPITTEEPIESPIAPTTEEDSFDLLNPAPVSEPTVNPIAAENATNTPNENTSTPVEIPLPVESTDETIDALISNEQTQATTANSIDDTSNTPASSEGLDLDALTSDIAATNPTEQPAASVVDPTADIPVTSVTLPGATLVQPTVHSSTKKKAFAMIAAFLLLLVVG